MKNHPNRPLIQIALDTLTMAEAISAAKAVEAYVDIIEVGTILLAAVGKVAIDVLRATFPNKIIVADMKIADAGSVFGKMAFDAKADLVTVICAADVNTIKGVAQLANQYQYRPEVQIELTQDVTESQLAAWKQAGATHLVFHRSRDAQSAGVNWTEQNLVDLKMMIDYGFKVSITGGIAVEDIKFFQGLKPYCFIAGRTIRGENALVNAQKLQAEVIKYFG